MATATDIGSNSGQREDISQEIRGRVSANSGFVENKNPGYGRNAPESWAGGASRPSKMPELTEQEQRLLADFRKVPEGERAAVLDLVAKAARETTVHGIAEPRPEPAPTASSAAAMASAEGLQWPSEKWDDSTDKAFRKRYAIISFLKRVWNPFIERTGIVVTRDVLKIKDEGAEGALGNYIVNNRNNPKGLERLKDLLILYDTEARDYLAAARPAEATSSVPQLRIPEMF